MSRRGAGLLCALLALPSAALGQATATLAGTWSGAVEPADGDAVTLEISIERGAGGFWIGTLDAPVWQAEAVALDTVSINAAREVWLSAGGMSGAPEFLGRLSPDGSEIVGEVSIDPPSEAPATDIYLMELEIGGPFWRLGAPLNITDRDGYDNQPRFLPGDSALLYTSIREGQADVYRYDLRGRKSTRLTYTSESEYSPTPLPSADGFSTVRVEDDGTQRLWSFDILGQEPVLLLDELEPVGYHGWLDQHRLGIFVLGTPPTLRLAELDRQIATILAESVGRSIHRTPDGKAVSFVHKASESDWTLDRIELESGERRTLIATRAGSEDFAWAPDGRILMGQGSRLFTCVPDDETPTWRLAANLSPHGIDGITRLDVSADGRWLAVVGERPPAGPPPERIRSPFRLRRSTSSPDG